MRSWVVSGCRACCCLAKISSRQHFLRSFVAPALGRVGPIRGHLIETRIDMSVWSRAIGRPTARVFKPLQAESFVQSRNIFNSSLIRAHGGIALSLCRRHGMEVRMKKDVIRRHIQALEASRRKFSTSPAQKHGHIDPPKPGEEYVGKEHWDGNRSLRQDTRNLCR